MLYGRGDKKDYVRDLIDADMLIYLSENYQGAGKAFLDTYAKMQLMNSDMSAGEATKAALSSETSTKYSGAEYERYLVWSMRLASALAIVLLPVDECPSIAIVIFFNAMIPN